MTATDGLARLLEQATPGPWYAVVNDLIGGSLVATEDRPASELDPRCGAREVADMVSDKNARLIALAPDMARLLIDMADTLRPLAGRPDPLTDKINALLARFADLEGNAT